MGTIVVGSVSDLASKATKRFAHVTKSCMEDSHWCYHGGRMEVAWRMRRWGGQCCQQHFEDTFSSCLCKRSLPSRMRTDEYSEFEPFRRRSVVVPFDPGICVLTILFGFFRWPVQLGRASLPPVHELRSRVEISLTLFFEKSHEMTSSDVKD